LQRRPSASICGTAGFDKAAGEGTSVAGLTGLFRRRTREPELAALYGAIVVAARSPDWYRYGAVPDTLDGRFDMIAAVFALVLLRIEAEGEAGRAPAAMLTERFIDDMDGQLRQLGIGDIVVGKHMGKMMSALGGRLGAYRDGLAGGDFADALARNLYRGAEVDPVALAFSEARLRELADKLAATPADELLTGQLPAS
jgi:cytochrome b pre-mRNA-processing protein 3